MKLILIRHFVAEGNLRHAYIGRTDDPLADCPENERLRQKEYPQAEVLVASPLLRCRQTAEWIYHRKPDIVAEELREMDFGEFENKNYEELKDDPRYRAWLELEGEGITPGGENRADFICRTRRGFRKLLEQLLEERVDNAAVVAHGGTIMAVLSDLTGKENSYYDWQAENGGAYLLEIDPERWKMEGRLTELRKL